MLNTGGNTGKTSPRDECPKERKMTDDKFDLNTVKSESVGDGLDQFHEIPDFYNNMGKEVIVKTSNFNLEKSVTSFGIGHPNSSSKSTSR